MKPNWEIGVTLRALASELEEKAEWLRQGCHGKNHRAFNMVIDGFTGEIKRGCFCHEAASLAKRKG
jgi:hypothetical protein